MTSLELLGQSHHDDYAGLNNGRDLIDGLLDTVEGLLGDDSRGFHAAVASVLVRVIETRLLTDPGLTVLVDGGSTRHDLSSQVTARVQALTGLQVPPATARYLVDRLETLSPGYARTGYEQHFWAIVRRDFTERGCTEFRCRTCGFWFQRSDLVKNGDETAVERRQAGLFDLGLSLAPALHADRETDPLKPFRSPRDVVTWVTIDHVVPRSGGGADDPDNLKVVCGHCNFGKMIYRMPMESISTAIAGSLTVLTHSVPRQISIVSALLSANGRCTAAGCTATVDDAELTVVLDPFDGPRWGAPWNLRVRCYRCAQGALQAMRTHLADASG